MESEVPPLSPLPSLLPSLSPVPKELPDTTFDRTPEPLNTPIGSPVACFSPIPTPNHSLVQSIVLGVLREDWQYLIRKWHGVDRYLIPHEDIIMKEKFCKIFHDLKKNSTALNNKVCSFIDRIRLDPLTDFGLNEAKLIQVYINENYGDGQYRIHVFEKVDGMCNLVWVGGFPSHRNIVVLKEGSIFSPVFFMNQLYRKKYYCFDCNQILARKICHNCSWMCKSCGRPSLICKPDFPNILLHCDSCGLSFSSRSCYQTHLHSGSGKSKRCGVVCQCVNCAKTYNTWHLNGEKHICGQTTYCQKCNRHVENSIDHACYTRAPTPAMRREKEEDQMFLKILVFDFECMQSENVNGDTQYLPKHEVVCVAIRKACYNCFELDKDDPCEVCVEREKIISYLDGPNVLELFVDWLVKQENNDRVIFAHNGGRYDHLILLDELVRREHIKLELTLKGNRIIFGSIDAPKCKMKIRDSYNLIPVPLGGFKKAFGLTCNDKGEFPFLFIQKENFHTVTVGLPNIDYYNPDGKSVQKKEAFLEWYQSHDPQYPFDFDSELISYCKQDVIILLLGLIAYRKAMMTATNWDPLTHSCTIASFTQHVLRYDHIPAKTLVNIPENGYNFRRQQSDIALKWLKWKIHKEGIIIRHLENGGEKSFRIDKHTYYVDGWTPPVDGHQRGTIWELLGCFWHGCDQCFLPEVLNKSCNQTFGALRAQTEYRLNQLRKLHNVEVKWECDVRKELKTKKEMQEFFHTCLIGRLHPRIAMQGGRTEAHARYAESSATHKLVYYDVISLYCRKITILAQRLFHRYPTVMFDTDLPIGKPTIVTEDFPQTPCTSFDYRGIGYITILPPNNLRYPLLAVKMNNQLLFTLCKLCAATRSKPPCHHTTKERSITGAWTHLEIQPLNSATLLPNFMRFGHGKLSQVTSSSNTLEHFSKIKTESSGWPSWVKTREDEDKFIAKYRDEMGITIERDNVCNNPALRSVSKLLLNTSWGKYAQNPFSKQYKIVDEENMIALMKMKSPAPTNYKIVADDKYLVSYENICEEVHSTPYGNLPIAIYITSAARLRLYDMLVASNGEALYNDTDSVIALIPRDNNPFSSMIGDSLGQLTDETAGREIEKAVLGGPKQYALKLKDNETGETSYILKLRGMVMDAAASEKIHFQSFHDRVMEINTDPLVTERITLKRKMPGIMTVPEKKKYDPVNDKGYRYTDDRIYPFGYEQPRDC